MLIVKNRNTEKCKKKNGITTRALLPQGHCPQA